MCFYFYTTSILRTLPEAAPASTTIFTQAVLASTNNLCFSRNKIIITIFLLKIFIFTAEINRSVLHCSIVVLT